MSKTEVQSVDPDTSTDEIEAIIERDGCIILREVMGAPQVDRMLADLKPYIDRKPKGTGEFTGYETKRLQALFTKTEHVGNFIVNPKIIEILDRFLGPYCDNFTLSSCSITAIGPGQTPQPLHRDDMLYPLAHPSERNAVATCFWALSDFRSENGATRLVPRSHRWDDERVPLETETVQAVMPKGSVCLFLGSLYHGGGRNTTADEWRIGMFAGYCLGWLRQEQNMYLTVPPEAARHLPEKLARVLGYSVHKPFLGFVQDLKDPWDFIQGYEELSEGGGDLAATGTYGVAQGRKVRVM